jgi:Arc/MetJ-type ribon-helix-helix transcriptional regulator
MQIQLSPEQSSFIDLGIQEGRLRDPEEAMQQALTLWVKRERARLDLLVEIDAGDNSPREDDTVLDSEEEIAEFFAGVNQRGQSRHMSTKLSGV